MGQKMGQAPVFYTLSQVVFNPILQMAEFVPKIQDRLRLEGFPDFRKEQIRQIALALRQAEGEAPQVATQEGPTRWNFVDAGRTSGYLLQPNTLVYHTTAYETFEVFSKRLLDGLRLVHEHVGLAFIQRIGLRYLDAVLPKEGENLGQYLSASVLGLSSVVKGQLQHCFTETANVTSDGTLVARVLITEGDLAIPPDLFPFGLALGERFAKIKGRHAVLDTDHFSVERFDFDLNRVAALLDASHTRIDEAFRLTATDYARKAWKQ